MSTLKKLVCVLLTVVLLVSTLLFSSCSTPKVAMTVDGKEYTSGEYLAYLYNTFYDLYYQQGLYYYAMYSQDIWAMEFPYGEDEDTAVKLKLSDYIKQTAQDTIIRQKALENKLAETGLKWREEDVKNVDEALSGVAEDQFLPYGISKESFAKMYRAVNCNEAALFYGTYDKGGSKAMTEEEIRAYFDENFLSYKIIEMSLVDSDGKDLSDAKKKEVKDELQKYLNQYNTSKDFDAVLETYKADEAAKTTTTTTGTGTTTTGTGTTTGATTTAAATTTTNATTTTTAATTTTTTAADGSADADKDADDADDEEEEDNSDPNRRDIDANTYGDEDFTNAIKSVNINEAKIVEYKKGGTTNTAALILRLDPEERTDSEDYFADNRNAIIYGAKYEEYNKELLAYIKTLTVDVNQSAIKVLDPKKFEG